MFRDKLWCFRCYDKEYKKLEISFVLGVISLAVVVISHFNWPTLTIGLIINIALPFCVPLVIIWLSNRSVVIVPDERYPIHVSCTLNSISTVLLHS
jgi:hypothetical protein